YAGHAKQVGQLVSQMPQNVFLGKYIIVVDEDVDVFDQSDVIWALGTRVHPPRDIHIEDYTLGASYDPIPYDYIYPGGRGSPEKGYYNARVVIDATKLYEARDEYPEVVRVSPELREKVSKKFPGLFDNLQ
ncbi:MAG TPA: UbiD family decarboxylase, partial [Halobacteriales archaeon]|nr:UbiD family decarboxylase [Halobacteriales archaeon]